MKSPANTPFADIVVVAADSHAELQAKVNWYLTQGYRITGAPNRFEDVTIDLEAAGKSVIQFPNATAGLAILMRNDPT